MMFKAEDPVRLRRSSTTFDLCLFSVCKQQLALDPVLYPRKHALPAARLKVRLNVRYMDLMTHFREMTHVFQNTEVSGDLLASAMFCKCHFEAANHRFLGVVVF